MYIKSIKLNKDKFCLKKGTVIEFKQLTLLVGDQGTGKSILLNLLKDNNIDYINVELSVDAMRYGVDFYYFDSESMNPRMQEAWEFSNPDGSSKGIGIAGKVFLKYQSHGEVLQEYTVNKIREAKDCILLLDEPEAALSLKNQFKLIESIKIALKNNVQIIMATHCLPLIEAFKEVYSMDDMSLTTSKEYVNNIKYNDEK